MVSVITRLFKCASVASALAVAGQAETFEYRLALPGYSHEFPRDHGSHGDFRTEWWYFTGHLKTSKGLRFGYELTFFRTGLRDVERKPSGSRWEVKDLYFAHFALTDIASKTFWYFERRGRTSVGVAGIRNTPLRVWIGDWSLRLDDQKFLLQARDGRFGVDLELVPAGSPVVHGRNGASQKSDGRGQATHYYSMTRLRTSGKLLLDGRETEVTGLSWMDHEFGSNQLSRDQAGWDWFSIQLEDDTELMLYRMRRKDGKPDQNSSGSLVQADGTKRHLDHSDFDIEATGHWTSPKSGGRYPMGWEVSVPAAGLRLRVTPDVLDQELVTRGSTQVTYWEGSVSVEGVSGGKKTKGRGYVEMTGYAGALGGKF